MYKFVQIVQETAADDRVLTVAIDKISMCYSRCCFTLLLQYIGDLQTCVPLFRGNCSHSRWHDSYNTTSLYILHWCRSRTITWFSETSCVGVPHTDVLSTASMCDLIFGCQPDTMTTIPNSRYGRITDI